MPLAAVALFAFAERKPQPEASTVITEATAPEPSLHPIPEVVAPVQAGKLSVPEPAPVAEEADATTARSKERTVEQTASKKMPQNSAALTDYRKIKKLKKGQTTRAEIQKQFGEPARTEVTGDMSNWYYEEELVKLAVRFDKGNKIESFTYELRNPTSTPDFTEEKIRAVKPDVTTEADLLKLFGKPSILTITNWYWKMEFLNQNSTSTLSAKFHEVTPNNDLLENYGFYSVSDNAVYITPGSTGFINKESTTKQDLVKEFGKPTKVRIDAREEKWEYISTSTDDFQSPYTRLSIIFKKENTDKIQHFAYEYHTVE